MASRSRDWRMADEQTARMTRTGDEKRRPTRTRERKRRRRRRSDRGAGLSSSTTRVSSLEGKERVVTVLQDE